MPVVFSALPNGIELFRSQNSPLAIPAKRGCIMHFVTMMCRAWSVPGRIGPVRSASPLQHAHALPELGAVITCVDRPREGFLFVTSRASFELVQKAAVFGVPLLAAVSRPTGLAIRMADAAGMCLAGLLRGPSTNVYTHPERVRRTRSED